MIQRDEPFSTVFARALQGIPCRVVGLDDGPSVLPMGEWTREADEQDLAVLAHCSGPTLDIGCGPGRMTASLARMGHQVLGIDVVPEAVEQTRQRGVPALLRDLYDALPDEGRWETVLLADGNVGIGGDPVALLRRSRELLGSFGRVVVEVAAPGTALSTRWVTLEAGEARSRPFRWSVVGADDIATVAAKAGLGVTTCTGVGSGDRWVSVLQVRG
ncbi:Mg-protoporphyrin IX methyl transferase [Nocardioides dokdonensis FR1436]|uniref:Mg-protoporphyrin IX methyl transferase n=1 Tax=Nocardioides dokdonensis FR1436 TaxID=1300347 RepID=A0A1A9GPG8_9ACTN|nr:class I SAM-dependent methyltransferase [Nocardioides dokdonensis]ANH39335.1 Mg-protoporphyrin IX methyl transferase [Nocardioides dokdonensis FR1436]